LNLELQYRQTLLDRKFRPSSRTGGNSTVNVTSARDLYQKSELPS
jgi:hypothetical protein